MLLYLFDEVATRIAVHLRPVAWSPTVGRMLFYASLQTLFKIVD
jgi:hypothetical protein